MKRILLFSALVIFAVLPVYSQVPSQITTTFDQDCNNYFDIPYATVNNKVFYKVNYDMLWVTDGTSGGSMLLKDFNMSNWSIGNFIVLNNLLLFTAQLNGDGSNLQLWKSDGTVGGTQQVAVIGQDCSNYFNIPYTIVNNKVYFKINYDILRVSDGTTGGTQLLKNFNMSNYSIGNFIALNNMLLFTAQLNGDGTNVQLWKSDGTTGGTQQVSVIGHDYNNYFDIPYAILNNQVFLKINYDNLWVTDGTSGGTQLLKNFNMSIFSIGNFIVLNNMFLFTAQLNGDGTNVQLWKSDGTTGGTQQVSVIGQDYNNYFNIPYTIINNKVFFKINYDVLWVSDGTSGGTQLLKNFNMSNYSIGNFIALNNVLLLTAQLNGDGTNVQLWKSDGTTGGTQQIAVIGQDYNNYFEIPYGLISNKVFFKINYDDLWVSDGTSGGTQLLKNFNMSNWSIGNFIPFGNNLLFTAQLNGDGSNLDLWRSDGTVGGTMALTSLGQDANSYFTFPYTSTPDVIYMKIMFDQLWISNGTAPGTHLVKDFNMSNWSIGNFVTLGSNLLLTAQDNGDGSAVDLWSLAMPTALQEQSKSAFVISPVPARSYLNVTLTQPAENVVYSVCDVNGRIFQQGTLIMTGRIELDPSISCGYYFLHLSSKNFEGIKKFSVTE